MTMTTEATRDAVLVALQGATMPLDAGELAAIAQVKNRDLIAVLPALIADGIVVSSRDGYAMSRGETIAAAASVDEDRLEAPEYGATHDMGEFVPPTIAPGDAAPVAPSGQDGLDAGVTVADVLARLDGPIRVRAEVVLEARADGTMAVAQLLRVIGLG